MIGFMTRRNLIVIYGAGNMQREVGETAIMGTLNKDAATLLTISDMSVLETLVKVDETDVARISVGDSAQVQIDAFPDTTFLGRVTQISNSSVNRAVTQQQLGVAQRGRGAAPCTERPNNTFAASLLLARCRCARQW